VHEKITGQSYSASDVENYHRLVNFIENEMHVLPEKKESKKET
jgi:hypothetical protein